MRSLIVHGRRTEVPPVAVVTSLPNDLEPLERFRAGSTSPARGSLDDLSELLQVGGEGRR